MMKKVLFPCLAIFALLLSGCIGSNQPVISSLETAQHTDAPVPVTTTAPGSSTQAETTSAPTEQAPQAPAPVAVSLSREVQYRINLFLSNFSEQWFHEGWVWQSSQSRDDLGEFVSKDADPMELVSFAWLYAKINLGDYETVWQADAPYYGVSLDTINTVCKRFFDRSITQTDIVPIPFADGWYDYDYCLIDGMVCRPAADGESYNHMTVANEMYDLGDATYGVYFHIYSISDMGRDNSIVLAGGIVQDKSVYYYTDADAAANSYFSYYRSGYAEVRPYTTVGGTESYQLLSYVLY